MSTTKEQLRMSTQKLKGEQPTDAAQSPAAEAETASSAAAAETQHAEAVRNEAPAKHAGGRPISGAERASKRVSLLMMPSRFAELDAISKQRRTPINALINEAIEVWLQQK